MTNDYSMYTNGDNNDLATKMSSNENYQWLKINSPERQTMNKGVEMFWKIHNIIQYYKPLEK